MKLIEVILMMFILVLVLNAVVRLMSDISLTTAKTVSLRKDLYEMRQQRIEREEREAESADESGMIGGDL